jgi:hypothetical protein
MSNEELKKKIDNLIRLAMSYGRADAMLDQMSFGGEMGLEDAMYELFDAKKKLFAELDELTLIGDN